VTRLRLDFFNYWKVSKKSPPSSELLSSVLKCKEPVFAFAFAFAFVFAFVFAFTRLEDLWYLDVRLVMRTSTEDAGEDAGDDNITGDSERFLSFFGVFRRGACFRATGCFTAGGRLVCFLLVGMV